MRICGLTSTEWSAAADPTRLGWGLLVAGGVGAGHKLDGYFVQGNPLVGQGQEMWHCVQCAH